MVLKIMMMGESCSTESLSGHLSRTRRVASRRLSLSSLDTDSGAQPGANKNADRWAWLDLCPCSHAPSSPSLQSVPSSSELEPSPATTCDDEPQSGGPLKALVAYQPRKYFEQSGFVGHNPSIRSRRFFQSRQRFPNQQKIGLHNSTFTSSNVYVRPLPPSFTGRDLYELCMSMVRSARSTANRGGATASKKKFEIVSVKVMLDEDESGVVSGTCKGFGFCLWNCVEASSSCIQGLLENGYQANFARETSRGMLSSLADPTSANVYLSNLPHHWGEEDLKALFGDTPIASVRVLRDRDDEVVGSGASRGVGFVRLACRSDALHFVELLHGMPIKGTNGYIQCRIADNLAQKEWKRNMRGTQRDEKIEPDGGAFRSGRDAMVVPSVKKWAPKKVDPRPPARFLDEPRPDGRPPPRLLGRGVSQAGPAPFSESTAEGGLCYVGLAPPLLMPPFHAAGGGGSTGANSPVTPPAGELLFPVTSLVPMFPPAWLAAPRAGFQAPHLPPVAHAWPPEYRLICGPELQPCPPDRLQPIMPDEQIWNSPPAESQSSSSSSLVWNTTTPHFSPPNNTPPVITHSAGPSPQVPAPQVPAPQVSAPLAALPESAGLSQTFFSFGDGEFHHHLSSPTDCHHHYLNPQQQVFREIEPGVLGVVSTSTSGM